MAAYASLPLGAARRACAPSPTDGNKHGHLGDPPRRRGRTRVSSRSSCLYTYDVAKHGHESGHTGVMLPDPSRAAHEGRAKARERAKEEKEEEVVVEKEVKEEEVVVENAARAPVRARRGERLTRTKTRNEPRRVRNRTESTHLVYSSSSVCEY